MKALKFTEQQSGLSCGRQVKVAIGDGTRNSKSFDTQDTHIVFDFGIFPRCSPASNVSRNIGNHRPPICG